MVKPYLTPMRGAFVGSLILSMVALSFEPVIGRDAAFYVDNARIFLEQGAGSLLVQFSWPWFSALIGVTHQLTGLSLIASGYVWVFLFTAGTCAVLVRCVEMMQPKAGYWAVLVVLAIPAYNEYRDQIFREPGFWFFSSIALLCMIVFEQRRRWRDLGVAVVAVLCAAAFRLEATFMLVSIALTLIWVQRQYLINHYRGGLISVALTLLILISCGVILRAYADMVRVDYYLGMIAIDSLFSELQSVAADLRQGVLHSHSHGHAVPVILFGFFMTILFSALAAMGPFVVSFLMGMNREGVVKADYQYVFILISLLLYLAILMVFFIQERFIIDRYISFLHILLTPSIALSAWHLQSRYLALGRVILAIALIAGVANVISTSSKRTHYLDAAQWAKTHLASDARVYFYEPRLSFYSGRGYNRTDMSSSEALEQQLEQFDYFFVDLPLDDLIVQEKLASGDLEYLGSFDNGDDRQLIILGKRDRSSRSGAMRLIR